MNRPDVNTNKYYDEEAPRLVAEDINELFISNKRSNEVESIQYVLRNYYPQLYNSIIK